MKTIQLLFAFLMLSISTQAQTLFNDPYRGDYSTDYSIELAIQYEDKLLSEMPWSNEKLFLGMEMYGNVSLKILDDSERLTSIDPPTFQIAIKDNKSGTQRMFSNQIYTSINAEEIVKKCKEGESIIILTTDGKYILRTNSIELLLGC